MMRAAMEGELAPRDPSVKLFAAIDDYLEAKKATANSERTIEFDRERLEIVKRHLGDVKLSTITRKLIEGFQAKRRLEGSSNRTINMDVGALPQVLRRFKQWRRLDLEKVWDVDSATGKGVLYVTRSKNETSQRPLNQAAREAVERTLSRADALGHTDPEHYIWCASQHHKHDPGKPARKWDGA